MVHLPRVTLTHLYFVYLESIKGTHKSDASMRKIETSLPQHIRGINMHVYRSLLCMRSVALNGMIHMVKFVEDHKCEKYANHRFVFLPLRVFLTSSKCYALHAKHLSTAIILLRGVFTIMR